MFNQFAKLSIVASALLVFTTTSVVAENLIQNGSFEDYTVNKDMGRWKLVEFPNWTGLGELWNSNLGKDATDGTHKIELDIGRELNELSQIVTTVKGTKYKLSLDVYARRSKTSDFQILIDDEVIATIKPDRKWSEHSTYFIGTGTQQVVTLKEINTQSNGLGAILDNVKLEVSQEMIVNGSFEFYTLNRDYGRWQDVTFDAWEGRGESWNNRLGKRSTKGSRKVELDVGRELNALSQMVTTKNGVEYELTLDAYARRVKSSDFEIWIDDEKLETVRPIKSWKNYSFKFFGNGEAQKISIKEVSSQNNGLGTVIDNVSLVPTGKLENTSPVIEGVATKTINIDEVFSFTPTAYDLDGDILTFTIQNKPSWAEFNTTTGGLEGLVSSGSEGSYNNIIISVSDGTETVSLAPFDIEVQSPFDIAYSFGKATQGTDSSYYYYAPALSAIDNNDTTNNHTSGGKDGKNWLQIELPNPTTISKILLQSRSQASRLTNAKVYLSNTPYTGTVDESTFIKTLEATTNEQVITLDASKSGNYLLIKGEVRSEDDRHIHLTKLEVYGEMPNAPVFNPSEDEYLIEGVTSIGTVITTLSSLDYQGDTLTYSIVGNVPFSINAQGEVSVNGVLIDSVYTVEVQVSDGVNTTTTTLTVNVTSSDAIAEVLASGDVINTKVTEDELINATLDTIEEGKNLLFDAKVKIFNLNSDGSEKDDASSLSNIIWNPTHDASLFTSMSGTNAALLYTNAVAKDVYTIYKKEIAIMGEKDAGRYMVFGGNPLRTVGNDDMNQLLENSIAWLSNRDDLKTTPFNVVIAHLDDSYWFRDESKTRDWLDTHYASQVNYNSADVCDGIALQGCLDNKPDLLIVSQISTDTEDVAAIASTVSQALKNGISVLYIHHDGNHKPLGKELFASVFDVRYESDNYWTKLTVDAYNPVVDLNVLSDDMKQVQNMFTHFKEVDYAFDWSRCKDSSGNYGERNDNCSEVVGLTSEFEGAASFVKEMIDGLDKAKKNIFENSAYRLQKLLTLTADKFRQSVSYPMDKVTTDNNDFMKSYYADHAIYNYRTVNPKQLDMGNFSRSDFSNITPTTRQVQVNSKKYFRSTGAYALPGQTVTVTRNDSSDLTVKVFVNTLRPGATHQYQVNAYNRPKYLQTSHFEIKSGETIEFTSPYGGPLQLEFSANDLPVDVTFENVGEHAYWASTVDNASFAQKLTANEYEWAEIATAGFEVHSKLDKMVESVSDVRWGGTAEGLAEAVVKYTSNYPHVLAGFKGEGVDVVPEIHDWATAKGVTIETIDIMKHMNADQAACGYGCSGNPYDAYWSFNPIAHGDIHELGHSLQKKGFEGFANHSGTNTFSYYTKSRYFANTGGEPTCQSLPFKSVFDTVQSSVGQSDVQAYLKTNLWDIAGLGEQYLLKIQAMMHVQKLGKIENGWHVLARVHILEREMKRAKTDWDAKKDSVGFSTYTLDEINAIGDNDWLIVAYSYASEVDLRNYFTMMGIPFSQKAKDQIASFNFDIVPNALFVSTLHGYCKTDDYGTLFDRPTLDMDGMTLFPY